MNAVHAVEEACHRFLRDPKDDLVRASLLDALARYKAIPLDAFPATVIGLVRTSHEQADELSNRILASNNLSEPRIRQEAEAVCRTISSLASELTPPHSMRGANVNSGRRVG